MIELVLILIFFVVFYTLYTLLKNMNTCIKYSESIPTSTDSQAISIIKPSKGINVFTSSNFFSWVNQKYDSQIEIIFAFDEADPGINLAKELKLPNVKIVSRPILDGFTGKMSALYHGLEQASHELLVFSDGDTRASDTTCSQIMTQIRMGAQIVTCPARYTSAQNIWGRIYASLWNLVEFGFVGTEIVEYGDKVFGTTFALSTQTLTLLGGLSMFKNYIAEDMALGQKAKKKRVSIVLGPIIESPVGRMTFTKLMAKFSRAALYAKTMRRFRENWRFVAIYSYIFVIISPALFLGDLLIVLVLGLASARLVFGTYAWYRITYEKRVLYSCFLGDVLFLLIYLITFITRTAKWSGRTYRVFSNGKMKRKERN
jgi:cellulose synthase/poly-beta-1,6-N-acetylglucosamine synthase-like glycosyltransferase